MSPYWSSYCSANTIPSQGVRYRRIADSSALLCHPASLTQRILFSGLKRSATRRSTLLVIAGDANTQTLPLAVSFGFARSNHSPIHARKSLALSHWLSHSSSFTWKYGGSVRRQPMSSGRLGLTSNAFPLERVT